MAPIMFVSFPTQPNQKPRNDSDEALKTDCRTERVSGFSHVTVYKRKHTGSSITPQNSEDFSLANLEKRRHGPYPACQVTPYEVAHEGEILAILPSVFALQSLR